MGIFRFDATGQIVGFEEKPNARTARRRSARASRPASRFMQPGRREAVRRLDGHLRLHARRPARGARAARGRGLRPRDHPGRARHAPRERLPVPRLLAGRRHGGVVLRREHHAHAAERALQLLRPAAAGLHAAALPARRRGSTAAPWTRRSSPRAATSTSPTITQSIVGIRTRIGRGCAISRSVLLGADFYENDDDAPVHDGGGPELGIGADSVLDRVIVDKNARIGDGVRLDERSRRAERRRRRLLHPQRHHHRPQVGHGRRDVA